VKPISRATDLAIELYDRDAELLTTVAVPGPVDGHAVAGSLDLLAYVTAEGVVCIDRTGRQRWRVALPGVRKDCAFSADDALIWVYAPGEPDRWLALAAATGEPRIVHELPSAGQGGNQFATPDGGFMVLDVGEGAGGSRVFRAGPGDELHGYPGRDRVLIDLAPDGSRLMTVHHEQRDVAFHAFPDGGIQARVPVAAFGHQDAGIEWTGGFLDRDTAVVVLAGENREGPWWQHHTVDVRTGEVTGILPVTTVDEYDLRPLGDGGYLVTDTDGTLRRLDRR
jgi:hypothetical protein